MKEKTFWTMIVVAIIVTVAAAILFQGCASSYMRSWAYDVPAVGYEKGNPGRYGLGYVREVPPIQVPRF